MTCNRAGSDVDTGYLKNSITLYIPSDTVDDVVDALNMGAGAAGALAALEQGGVISAPAGWVTAAVGAVLVMIGSGLSLFDRGCGVKISVSVITGVPTPIYTVWPQ